MSGRRVVGGDKVRGGGKEQVSTALRYGKDLAFTLSVMGPVGRSEEGLTRPTF